MHPDIQSFSSDLDWMMQSPQVSDEQLIQILVNEYFAKLVRLIATITGMIKQPLWPPKEQSPER